MRAIAFTAAALILAGCQSTDQTASAPAAAPEKSAADASARAPMPSTPSPGTMNPDVEAGIETPKAPPGELAPPDPSPESPR
jgi:hypothetical protein